jgi:hypothetical protein
VHISVKVDAMIPKVSDDRESLLVMLETLQRAGSSSVHLSLIEDLSVKQTQKLLDLAVDQPELIEQWVEDFNLDVEDDLLNEGTMQLTQKMREDFALVIEELLTEVGLSTSVPRFIPKDYRFSNYLLSERLFKRATQKERQGDDVSDMLEIAKTIESLDHAVTKAELEKFARCESARRDIDYFLFSGELKSYGQMQLF